MKRKQVAAPSNTFRKRAKISPPPQHPHGDVDYAKEYKIKSILDEKGKQYLIDWEDDELTGERYQPSWEPKGNANKEAIADWNLQKARLKKTQTPKKNAGVTAKRGRPRKIIESSPPEVSSASALSAKQSYLSSTAQPSQANDPVESESENVHEHEPEIVESQPDTTGGAEQVDSPLFEPIDGPAVEPSDPPSSFAEGAYQKFSSSQAGPSSAPATADQQPSSTLSGEQSQARSVPVNFEGTSRVVPDSQSAIEFSSSAPATTTTTSGEPAESTAAPAVESGASDSQGPIFPSSAPAVTTTREATESSAAPAAEAGGHEDQSAAETQTNWPEGGAVEPFPSSAPAATTTEETTESSAVPAVEAGALAVQSQSNYQSLPSTLPFQTQLARPSTSGGSHSVSHLGEHIRHSWALLGAERTSSFPSSPIASLPSQSIGTVGESAPPRPATPSSPVSISTPISTRMMETSQASQRTIDSTSELAAKLKAIQEKNRARREGTVPTSAPPKHEGSARATREPSQMSQSSSIGLLTQPPRLVSSLVAAEHDRRSPSQVPAMEPSAVVTQEEMNTSERYETLLPQEESTSGEQHRKQSIAGIGTLSRQQTRAEDPQLAFSYVVPIALLGHQRDQYPSTVYYQKDVIERFLATSNPDAELVAAAEHLVERLRKIALHPDLDNAETLTQYDVEPKQEAQWAVDCSAKFRFLKALFDGVRDQTLHVAILAQPGRILQMLATFLTGINVPHRRVDDLLETSLASDHDGLMCTLMSVEDNVGDPQHSPADIVIAMEPTVSEECMPIRALMQTGVRRPPLITLVIPGTVEHVEQSVSNMIAPRTRLRALISGIWQYRGEAGILEHEQMAPDVAASQIAQYLSTQEERGEWPLATLDPLPNLDSQTDSDIESASMQDIDGSAQAVGASTVAKRGLDNDGYAGDTVDISKKARYEHSLPSEATGLPTTINPQDIELTHVSDSVNKPTQPSLPTDAEGPHHFTLLTNTERSLHRLLKEAQERLEEHVQALSDLQYRHEEQREKLFEVTNTRDSAILTAQQAVTRMTEAANNVSALKAECTVLKQQLAEANAKLLNHDIPERAELETLRLAAMQAEAEKDQLEKRLQSAKEENEYSRAGYQSASQGAQNYASQNTELENKIAVLQNKATGEQAKLRQMGYDSFSQHLRDENKKLRAALKECEAGLKFRDRLREANAAGRVTRGSSVPRSPRV